MNEKKIENEYEFFLTKIEYEKKKKTKLVFKIKIIEIEFEKKITLNLEKK